ncbi:Rossmann-fold NAD(P)-binding domain-containing protein [Listeria seeligeri]|uniref:malate dehydrogenase n=1 Tax=Listeria seeligeri TaxID=1640 RepID=UPI0010ECA1F0|nr:malate dehydrogenase [Listeria seeligeri]MBC1421776.1 malate dehydrogenase [Listeria seeligeri]MBC1444275.1 malate dehydrogenase [Listeria seeligeri]MBC1480250.1 malate dehydrogenase [Listeria seeligeri]MBC1528516.1 malate dehydrogenase [Listeria seeligeri]MBC1539115.1 malate dehydrogenase [Listeria seeligeri]
MASKKKKIVVIGRSNLQNLYIHTVLLKKLSAEIYLIDDLAKASVQDFEYASYYHPAATISTGSFNECRNADLVVFFQEEMSDSTISKEENLALIKEKVKKMMATGFQGIVLVSTAESNVVAALIKRFSGLPGNQIITLGTSLATSYFQVEIAKLFKISPKNVHGYIIGDNSSDVIPVWSRAFLGGKPILSYLTEEPKRITAEDLQNLANRMTKIPDFPFENKDGCTFRFSTVTVLAELTEVILRDEARVLTVGVEVKSAYGLDEPVFVSVPAVIGASGVQELLELNLSEDEQKELKQIATKTTQKLELMQLDKGGIS